MKPADLCGRSGVSIWALKRARRSTQQMAKASAANQPRRGTSCKRPQEDDQRRRHAEGNRIRQAVQLGAETRLGLEHAGNPAIDAIEHPGQNHRQNRFLPIALNGEADAGQAAAQRARGDGIGITARKGKPPGRRALRSKRRRGVTG
jgi:hypothetical protein